MSTLRLADPRDLPWPDTCICGYLPRLLDDACPKCRTPRPTPEDPADNLPAPIDWHELFNNEREDPGWVVDDMWPAGRLLAIVAPVKAGKSLLMLWLAGCLSAGRHPWTGRRVEPVKVVYVDYEMTEDDLLSRLEDMAFTPDDLGHLTYYLRPDLGWLETPAGGERLLALAQRDQAAAVVIDTFVRAINPENDENAPQAFTSFYAHTGRPFKDAGIALARLDHTGHMDKKRARGSSNKGADIDLQWVITPTEDGIKLEHHGVTRVTGVPDHITLRIEDDPLRYQRAAAEYPVGTKEVADRLTKLGVPLGASKRDAARALREAGGKARNNVVLAALRWRREEVPFHPAGPPAGNGDHSGTTYLSTGGDHSGTTTPETALDLGGDHLGTTGDHLSGQSGTTPGPTQGTRWAPAPAEPVANDEGEDDEQPF